ncbi:MAG: HAMP domain-containing sensor histidine kinase [Oscillospiraceae bacterium]
MNFNVEMLNKIFDEYQTPVLLCDKNFCITAVNEFINKNNMNIPVGQHLTNAFPSNSIELNSALDKVLVGAPYFSTNFEYNLLKTTMCMFPIINENETTSILCLFDFADIGEAIHSYTGSVSSVISDRYRSPIAGIMNVSAILARRFQENEDYKSLEYLDHIAHCCYLMLNTSVSVQEYYLLVNSEREFKMKKLILNSFLENLCRTLQVLFVNSSFKLVFEDVCDDAIITKFDEDMLSLAIFQIIANSCNFSPKGSTIKLLISRSNNKASITISDEGIGIENKIINRVFDPFFSVHASPVPEENMGIGLGLPIAKKIVEEHNGQIFITSELNKGTTIVIVLPIVEDDGTELTLNSDTTKYVTNKFSNIYLIFANICNIKLY